MYKTAVRLALRHGLGRLNAGEAGVLLRLARPDARLAFPGANSWAAMNRPVEKGRHQHVTHRGRAELAAFAERYLAEGIQVVVEDVLVNGGPWKTRVAIRAHNFIRGDDGRDRYHNRFVAILELRWGRLSSWEDYEDTERVAAWERANGACVDPQREGSAASTSRRI